MWIVSWYNYQWVWIKIVNIAWNYLTSNVNLSIVTTDLEPSTNVKIKFKFIDTNYKAYTTIKIKIKLLLVITIIILFMFSIKIVHILGIYHSTICSNQCFYFLYSTYIGDSIRIPCIQIYYNIHTYSTMILSLFFHFFLENIYYILL